MLRGNLGGRIGSGFAVVIVAGCAQSNTAPVNSAPRERTMVTPQNRETTSDRNIYNVNVINAPAKDYVLPAEGEKTSSRGGGNAPSSRPAVSGLQNGPNGTVLASADGRFVQNVTVIVTGSSTQTPTSTANATGSSTQSAAVSPSANPSQTVTPSVSAAAGVALPGGSVSQQPTANQGSGQANPNNTTTAVPTNTQIRAPADVLGQLMQALGVPGTLQQQVLAAMQQNAPASAPSGR